MDIFESGHAGEEESQKLVIRYIMKSAEIKPRGPCFLWHYEGEAGSQADGILPKENFHTIFHILLNDDYYIINVTNFLLVKSQFWQPVVRI
jgi:hypothetical protein